MVATIERETETGLAEHCTWLTVTCRNERIKKRGGEPESCGQILATINIDNFVPGSVKLYCDHCHKSKIVDSVATT